MKILANTDFMNAFKTLNLKSQIEFNKSLEEICGLLILLPRHILAEFFKYIEYLKCPDKSRFKEKYIFDEVSCLYQNNSLLSETFDYFQNSFEIYLLLVKNEKISLILIIIIRTINFNRSCSRTTTIMTK